MRPPSSRVPVWLVICVGIGLHVGGEVQGRRVVGEGAIAGTIRDAASRAALTGAVVTLTGSAATEQVPVIVDGKGRFAFDRLPAGDYFVTAEKPGYVKGVFGRLRPTGSPVAITLDGTRLRPGVDIALERTGAVGGRVIGLDGEPIPACEIEIHEALPGKLQAKWISRQLVRTDDAGIFEFHSLIPGEYRVVVPARLHSAPAHPALPRRGDQEPDEREPREPARNSGIRGLPRAASDGVLLRGQEFIVQSPDPIATDFRDGASNWHPWIGEPVSVSSGGRVDLEVELVVAPTFTLSGHVALGAGLSHPVGVRVVRNTGGEYRYDTHAEAAATVTRPDGSFTVGGLAPGLYDVWAALGAAPGRSDAAWAATEVLVGPESAASVTLQLAPLASLSGALRLPPSVAAGAFASDSRVVFERVDDRVPGPSHLGTKNTAALSTHGTFEGALVLPGLYHLSVVGMPAGLRLAEVRGLGSARAGAFVSVGLGEHSLELILQSGGGSVSGEIRGGGGAEMLDAVVVFPGDVSQWLRPEARIEAFRHVRPDATGRFSLRGLRPGAYYMAVVPEAELEGWEAPTRLRTLVAHAQPMVVPADGGSISVSLERRR